MSSGIGGVTGGQPQPVTLQCSNCKQLKDIQQLMECAQCHLTRYCSTACKDIHAVTHKPMCDAYCQLNQLCTESRRETTGFINFLNSNNPELLSEEEWREAADHINIRLLQMNAVFDTLGIDKPSKG